jgi:hypothetical protein
VAISSDIWRLFVSFFQKAETNPIGPTNFHQSNLSDRIDPAQGVLGV